MELIEKLVREIGEYLWQTPEHWYLRLPMKDHDDWDLDGLIEERQIPLWFGELPLRLHRNTPMMRLDMDHEWWKEHYREDAAAETKMFEELVIVVTINDLVVTLFQSAGHDRTRLSRAERLVLKNKIIDAAVAQGMKRSLFECLRGHRTYLRCWQTPSVIFLELEPR